MNQKSGKQKLIHSLRLTAILCACICILQYTGHVGYVMAAESTTVETQAVTDVATETNTPEAEAPVTTVNTGVDTNLVFLIGTAVVTSAVMALSMSKKK